MSKRIFSHAECLIQSLTLSMERSTKCAQQCLANICHYRYFIQSLSERLQDMYLPKQYCSYKFVVIIIVIFYSQIASYQ